jgi:hypothetical protein
MLLYAAALCSDLDRQLLREPTFKKKEIKALDTRYGTVGFEPRPLGHTGQLAYHYSLGTFADTRFDGSATIVSLWGAWALDCKGSKGGVSGCSVRPQIHGLST